MIAFIGLAIFILFIIICSLMYNESIQHEMMLTFNTLDLNNEKKRAKDEKYAKLKNANLTNKVSKCFFPAYK